MVICWHFNRPSSLIEVRASFKVVCSLFSLRVISGKPERCYVVVPLI